MDDYPPRQATDQERRQLRQLVHQWNENRLDLFNLSEPTEDLEFHGVMRFYFQEAGERVATKCIRVSSTATTRAVIEALVEKFHPDLKMLTSPEYAIWEVHENGDERQLAPDEKPLLVQLNWHKDDREGRFLLRRHGAPHYLPLSALQLHNESAEDIARGMKRFSKREKKELKKKHQRDQAMLNYSSGEAEDVATQLYQQLPTNTFTRTISNPEVVMKKRRERKLESKLKEIGSGGSLKIYGADLSPSKPYVTLLVSIKDRASKIIRETLDKYGMERADPSDFVLVEVLLPQSENGGSMSQLAPIGERMLHEDECPLLALASRPLDAENVLFAVRRRPEGARRRRPSSSTMGQLPAPPHAVSSGDPCLLQLSPDGIESRLIPIHPNVTEVGSDRRLSLPGCQSIPLEGTYVQPHHCVIAFMDGVVTVTPSTTTAEIQVNGQQISQTTILKDRFLLRIARSHVFRFFQSRNSIGDNGLMAIRSEQANAFSGGRVSSLGRSKSAELERFRQIETIFDVDGKIETTAILESRPARPRLPSSGYERLGAASPSPSLLSNVSQFNRECLPAIVELPDSCEERLLNAVIRDLQPGRVQFKLAPVYLFYMVCRYRASPVYQPTLPPDLRMKRLCHLLQSIVHRIRQNIQEHNHFKEMQAMWMSNSAELLNLVRLDRDLAQATHGSGVVEMLSEVVEMAFGHLCSCIKQQIQLTMPALLDPDLDDNIAASGCISALGDAMRILRDCRLNAALTIQLYSQLFHFINMYLFNWLVSIEGAAYCSRAWGVRLTHRLKLIHAWAEQQGLELAAECHLDRIVQAARLLHTPKTIDHLGELGATCYKLNSYQEASSSGDHLLLEVRNLLGRYLRDVAEPDLTDELIENVARIAESQADEMARADHRPVVVEEDVHLHLPFLIPDDGYSPELVRGIPPSLSDLVVHLQQQGVCRLMPQPGSSGTWTVHLRGGQRSSTPSDAFTAAAAARSQRESSTMRPTALPEIVQISFPKNSTTGIGLSIVAAQGVGDRDVGIYVKKVVPGSAAAKDGRLEAGDQLVSVNGESLIGITQEQAAEKMARSGSEVSFKVSKQAARYNGLANWLCSPNSQQHNHKQFNNSHRINGATTPSANYDIIGNGSRSSIMSMQSTNAKPYATMENHNGYGDSMNRNHTRYQPGPSASRPQPPHLEPSAQPVHRAVRSASTSELYGHISSGFAPPPPSHGQYHNLPSHYRTSTASSRGEAPHRPVVIQPGRVSPSPLLRHLIAPSPTASLQSQHVYRARLPSTTSLQNPALTDYQNLPLIDSSSSLKPLYAYPATVSRRVAPTFSPSSSVHASPPSTVPHSTISPIRASPGHSTASTLSPPQEPITVLEQRRLSPPRSDTFRSTSDVNVLQVESQMQRLLNEELDEAVYHRAHESGSRRDNAVTVNGGSSPPHRIKTDTNGNVPIRPYLPFMHEMESKLSSDRVNGGSLGNKSPSRRSNQYETLIDDVHETAESIIEQDITIPTRSEMHDSLLNDERKRKSPPEPLKKKAVQFKEDKPLAPTPHTPTNDGKYVYEEEEPETPRVKVLGAQEIYKDPRQRRMHEIEARQQSSKLSVDGAQLGFKDKMRLFAQQIGEHTPKEKYKTSSAQREIEQSNDS